MALGGDGLQAQPYAPSWNFSSTQRGSLGTGAHPGGARTWVSMVRFCEWCPPQLPSVPFSSSVSSAGGATRVSQHAEVCMFSLQQPAQACFPPLHKLGNTKAWPPLRHRLVLPSVCLASISLAVQLELETRVDPQQSREVNELDLQDPTPGSQALHKLALLVPTGPQSRNPPPRLAGSGVGAGCPCH